MVLVKRCRALLVFYSFLRRRRVFVCLSVQEMSRNKCVQFMQNGADKIWCLGARTENKARIYLKV